VAQEVTWVEDLEHLVADLEVDQAAYQVVGQEEDLVVTSLVAHQGDHLALVAV
jgi:hypothetical protein